MMPRPIFTQDAMMAAKVVKFPKCTVLSLKREATRMAHFWGHELTPFLLAPVRGGFFCAVATQHV